MEVKLNKENLNLLLDTMRKSNGSTLDESARPWMNGYVDGVNTTLDLIGMVFADAIEEAPDSAVPAGLAKKITDAVFHFDPYNGTDYDDGLAETEKMLPSAAGCWQIISALCDMIMEG